MSDTRPDATRMKPTVPSTDLLFISSAASGQIEGSAAQELVLALQHAGTRAELVCAGVSPKVSGVSALRPMEWITAAPSARCYVAVTPDAALYARGAATFGKERSAVCGIALDTSAGDRNLWAFLPNLAVASASERAATGMGEEQIVSILPIGVGTEFFTARALRGEHSGLRVICVTDEAHFVSAEDLRAGIEGSRDGVSVSIVINGVPAPAYQTPRTRDVTYSPTSREWRAMLGGADVVVVLGSIDVHLTLRILAAGCGAVLPDLPTLRDYVGPDCASWVPADDDHRAAQATLQLLDDSVLRENLQRRGSQSAKPFEWKLLVESYRSYFESCVLEPESRSVREQELLRYFLLSRETELRMLTAIEKMEQEVGGELAPRAIPELFRGEADGDFLQKLRTSPWRRLLSMYEAARRAALQAHGEGDAELVKHSADSLFERVTRTISVRH
ncbi:MAG: glycosyltransferase [Deltaproteobacteria bacterium]|nr:glycosyltransferase [Deltaproteobacteria bacterium]